MDGLQANDGKPWFQSWLWHVSLALTGIAAFVAVAVVLDKDAGIPFKTTYRLVCTGACLLFIHKLRADYPSESWPRISFWIALLINVGIFFTPLADRPASRGEIMLFALPDAVVALAARVATYRAIDGHQRAIRQQMILGLAVAVALCAITITLTLLNPYVGHSRGPAWRLL